MAKSNKFSSKVPALADYKAPWVNEDGEVDVEAAKKAVHTLMVDKAKAQDAREDALAEVQEVTSERDELQTKLDSKTDPDAQEEIAKARSERDEAKTEAAEANLRADKIEIGVEKGLTPKQAKRLQGTNREELEADADELLADFPAKTEKTEDEEEESTEGRTAPRLSLVNPGDSGGSGGDANIDYEKEASRIMSGGIL